ncbi:MMPL family transporter [Kitasatospora sp. NPDC093806]|uniref:MMPL family transporter n=1 Tax=Kitasatospora sp. NPDC093806 TaxID=3155075 RepID=UPI003441D28D
MVDVTIGKEHGPVKKQPITVRVACWSALHPGKAIAGWFAFVVLCLAVGIAAGTNNAVAKDYYVGESGRADKIAAASGLQHKPAEQVMISAKSGTLDKAKADAVAADITARMGKLAEVEQVAAPVKSADGRMTMVEVTMKGPELEAKKNVAPLLEQTEQVQKANPDLVVEETGSGSVSKGLNEQRSSDLATSEAITFPVTLITLAVVFGSVLMVGVPLLLAISSIMAAMGLSMVISHVMPDAGVGNNVILLIGMAVGVDYALFYLKREREEQKNSGGKLSPEAVVEIAAATSGRAVMVSGVAVIISTATLYLATDIIFSSLATGAIVVVLVAMASSMTALPALLVKIGHRANRRAARRAAKDASRGTAPKAAKPRKAELGKAWTAVLRPASEKPVATLLISCLAMGALALPAFGMQLRVLNRDTHSRQIPAMQTYDRLNDAFPHLRVQHTVVVSADPGQAGAVGAALQELGRKAQADPVFAKGVQPQLQTSADKRVSQLTLNVPFRQSSDEAGASLDHLRDDYVPATVGKLSGAEFGVTGDSARDADYLTHQNDKLPLVVGFLLLLTFLMTAVVFRSVVIGLVGVVLNLISVGGSLGLLVIFFQWGLASTLFGFDESATNAIGSRVPLFLFVILFGLSMDYQVFVVSRIREAVLSGMPTRQAVLDGIARSAKVVTSAAAVMVTVFASFMFLHLAEMKQIGFSLAVAVLLDAFIIRVMILPAALTLLGRLAWWPAKLPRRGDDPAAPVPATVGTGV